MGSAQTKNIQFHYLTRSFVLRRRTELKHFISGLLSDHGKSIDHINYIFCDDQFLLELNRGFLKHNTLTDIITFELSPKRSPLLADIYISIERVKDNAHQLGISFQEEIHRVIFHGALHLCGYKDKAAAEIKKMRRAEAIYLQKYGFTWNKNAED